MSTTPQPDAGHVHASVIIPARNAASTIAAQLEAVLAQTYAGPWEVIVVDNGSTDTTADIVRSFASRFSRLGYVSCSRPGANAARNAGLAASSGWAVLLCDADDVVHENWVERMCSALERADLVVGAIDDRRLNPPEVLKGAPPRPPGLQVVANFLPRGITANLAVRRDVALAVGGFSERYEFGATDTEFCWRVQLAGYSIDFAPDAVVSWRRSGSLKVIARKAYLTGKARARLYADFRAAGMPRSSIARAGLTWLSLPLTAPRCVTTGGRRSWVRSLSAAAGRLVGSFRSRVLYL